MIYSNHLIHLLEVRNVSKTFSGSRALDDVSLEVRQGEVHALAGENGAGKSTLVKILAGLHRPDSGELVLKGRAVELRSPHDALRLGISLMHQELMPFRDMTVAENICMGRFARWVNRAAMARESRDLLGQLGMTIDPGRRIGELSVAEMQMVEIAKALGYRSELLIMDEPTSAISQREVDALLTLMSDLKRRGVTILYISHRMGELFRIADRITVLRDGRHVATAETGSVDEGQLIAWMVGRQLGTAQQAETHAPGDPVLEVAGLSRRGKFEDVSLTVRAGEIVGMAGLMGAGRTEVVSAIFGMEPAESGAIRIKGRPARVRTPADAMANGIALVTEDRKGSGIVPEMSVAANLTLASLKRVSLGQFVSAARESAVAKDQVRAFSIRCSGPAQRIKELSGGNQQKVMIARALLTDPDVILLDEPTRGIDVGAKAEVYGILRSLAQSGKAVLFVSSDLPEILALSDRVLVMREGRISGEFGAAEATAEEVLRRAMPQ